MEGKMERVLIQNPLKRPRACLQAILFLVAFVAISWIA